jgi:hypothetical protein
VSTFKSLFQGRRDLFQGLAIDAFECDWKMYPVLHLDMGSMQRPEVEEFEDSLCRSLDRLAVEHGVEISDHVYVMEFKRDKSASEALVQIKEKKYYEKFLGSGKKITLVGVNFDSEKRTIAEYLVEPIKGDTNG